ncbi:hypothetical protein EON66_00025 [archaeon]|nr:MAG: hypothetical protein EON66_00025 [archaeon]
MSQTLLHRGCGLPCAGAFLLCQEYATLKAASSMQTLSYTTVTIPEQQMLVAGVPSGVSPYQAF